jgi:hypothetical protein
MSSLLIMTLRVINKVLVQLQSLMPKIRTCARQVKAFTTLFFRRMEVQSLSFLRWIGLSKEPATGMSVDLDLLTGMKIPKSLAVEKYDSSE